MLQRLKYLALAASFDREVLKQLGSCLGEECQAENVGMLLGPGLNINWGAVKDRGKGLQAGLDLEMPGGPGVQDHKIVKAVQKGQLDRTTLSGRREQPCERVESDRCI